MTQKIRAFFKKWPLSLLVSVLLTSVPFLFMNIYYMYGDDYLMNYIANGSFGISNSDHLIFPKILFGTITKFLYGITAKVNWYCVLLVLSIAVAYAVFHWIIANLSENLLALIISLLMNALTVPMVLTFTTSAFLCVAAGAALLYYAAVSRKHVFWNMFFGAALAIWGYIIRNDTLFPGLVMMSPLALDYLIQLIRAKGDDRKAFIRNLLRLVAAASLSVVCLFGLHMWERKAYSSKTWQDFKAYNSARSSALDYPGVSYDQFEEAFTQIDFSKAQYALMFRWSFGEKKAFSAEKFSQIGSIIQNAYSNEARKNYTENSLISYPAYLIMVIPALLMLVLLFSDRKFKWWIAIFEVLGLTATLVMLCFVRLRFLLRVSVPLSMIAVLAMLLLTGGKPRKKAHYIPLLILSFVTAGASGYFLKGFFANVESLRTKGYVESSEAAREVIRSNPDNFYVVESNAFSRMFYYGFPTKEIKRIDDFQHVFRSGSWDTFSERYYDLISKFDDVDPDNLFSSLLDNEDAYLITDNGVFVQRLLQEENGDTIEMTKASVLGDGTWNLFQFKTEK